MKMNSVVGFKNMCQVNYKDTRIPLTKVQKQLFTDFLQNKCSQKCPKILRKNTCARLSFFNKNFIKKEALTQMCYQRHQNDINWGNIMALMTTLNMLPSLAITLGAAIQNILSKSRTFSKEISMMEFRYSETILTMKPMITITMTLWNFIIILWNFIRHLIVVFSQFKLYI